MALSFNFKTVQERVNTYLQLKMHEKCHDKGFKEKIKESRTEDEMISRETVFKVPFQRHSKV